MTDSPGLEQGYRRLLAWYPGAFRREHADEILAVLMAGAQPGQRRPGLKESADLFWSALTMRLRGTGPAKAQPWADALAMFSLVAPLFVLLVGILTVALPYRRQLPSQIAIPIQGAGSYLQIDGGPTLLGVHIFIITIGVEVIIAVLVLLGLRWPALAVMAALAIYWTAARQSIPWVPYPVQLTTTGVFLLEAAALTASPGPRRGRQLVSWRYAVVLLLAAAAVQVSTFLYDAMTFPMRFLPPHPSEPTVYLVGSIVLALAGVVLAVIWKLNRYFLLLLAAMFWPYAIQLAFTSTGGSTDLLGNPTPAHLAALYLPSLLFASGVLFTAVAPRRSRLLPS